jgi:hypothetical protein
MSTDATPESALDAAITELLMESFRKSEHVEAVLQRQVLVHSVYRECLKSGCKVQTFDHFTDYLLGRRMPFFHDVDATLPTPAEQRTQIARPLQLIRCAAWFYAQRFPENRRYLHRFLASNKRLPVVGCMSFKWLHAERVRVMSGHAAAACHHLATAPCTMHVRYKTMQRCEASIMGRVLNGLHCKVQVPLRCILLCRPLIHAAANTGCFSGLMAFIITAIACCSCILCCSQPYLRRANPIFV